MAAAVTSGLCAFDIGSDTGGSIRVPSHCCGTVGLKPTQGRVPRTGHAIGFGGLHDGLTQLGPIARSVDDLELILRVIAGLNRPNSGTVLVDGDEVTSRPPERRGMAMVFQSYALWPHMTIRQNVGFGLDVKKIPASEKKRQVDKVMKTVQIDHLADRKPGQLSGGQQQRVAVARAIVGRPSLVLADEPTGNLSSKAGEEVVARLEAARRAVDKKMFQ